MSNQKTSASKREQYTFFILLFLLIVLSLLRWKVFILANIPSESMLDTLQVEDKVFGNKLAYCKADPQRGDIVIFRAPDDESTPYIKRIIGLPGETVSIRDGNIYIDDNTVPLEENYLTRDWTKDNDGYIFLVPENSYFVLGDNRDNSYDARFWTKTFLPRENILARAEFIYSPFAHKKKLR